MSIQNFSKPFHRSNDILASRASNKEELAQLQSFQRELKHMFLNGGRDTSGKFNKTDNVFKNAMSIPNFSVVMKQTIVEVMQEAIEPILIGSRLLSRIDFDGYGTQITFGTIGAISGEFQMAEDQEYPAVDNLQMGGGPITANIGKFGLQFRISDTMMRYSQWDVIGMHIAAAAKALARYKEKRIFNMLINQGVVVFDNANPTSAVIGRTSGRDLSGAGNGSMTVDDLLDMYAQTLSQGFTPNVILMHPFAWAMWAKDPTLREMALSSGTMSNWYNMWQGDLKGINPYEQMGKMQGPTPYDRSPQERAPTDNTAPNVPVYFPYGNLTIIPSFLIPFDSSTRTTSVIMLDTENTGALIVQEEMTTEEWNKPETDTRNIKMRERYGMAIFHEGLGVTVARNVSIASNEIVLPPTAMVNGIAPIVRK